MHLERLERLPHLLRAGLTVVAVAAATGLIYALDTIAPTLSLGVIYLLAVVPVAVLWGLAYAVGASIVSMLAFNFLFLPPLYTFTLQDSQNWVALAVYVVVAAAVSELAARARRRAAEAEQREREEAFLAELATSFLQGTAVSSDVDGLAVRVAEILKAGAARIELGPQRDPPAGWSPLELRAGGSRVGTLLLKEGAEANLAIRRRFLPGLASLLAVAIERERLEHEALEAEALRRSDTIKTAVLRAVSHDLQSPLTAVIAAADTLRSPSMNLTSADRAQLLETITLEAGRLERLVRDLLDLSRLQAGAADPVLELWPVDDLISQALDDLGPAGARVSVSVASDLPAVQVDAGQVHRALANLLENALKFSPPGASVSVRASATRKDVIIRVVDQGPGIANEELERIFEPFYRSDEGSIRGSGLGLAIARGFVEANGGRIWAESRPSQGSSFAIALEAAPVPAAVES